MCPRVLCKEYGQTCMRSRYSHPGKVMPALHSPGRVQLGPTQLGNPVSPVSQCGQVPQEECCPFLWATGPFRRSCRLGAAPSSQRGVQLSLGQHLQATLWPGPRSGAQGRLPAEVPAAHSPGAGT